MGLENAYSVGTSNQIATYTYVPMQEGGTVMGEDGEGGGIIPNNFITSTVRSHFSSFGEI